MEDQRRTYSVGEITFYIKNQLENDNVLRDVQVSGEISNLTRHSSGHVYFSVKDEQAQLSCAMFRGVANRYLDRLPKHGQRVTLRGQLSVYPPRGNYQLIVQALAQAGMGDLHQQFLALRDRLRKEGLFEADKKQLIPRFPRTIGVVTSPTGAVIRDISDTIRRRFPHVQLLLAPAVVQGSAGAASIVAAIQALNARADVDVILLARGGGSLEDLWCFNDESVAHAIFGSQIPIISGVGHETDVTIADFVADLRAATPTAAAEQAVPVAAEIRAWLDENEKQLRRSLSQFADFRRQMLDDYAQRLQTRMQHMIALKRQSLQEQKGRLQTAMQAALSERRHLLELLETELHSLDIRKVLQRGYSVTENNGKRVTNAADLKEGDALVTHYYKGTTHSRVEKIDEDEGN